MTEQSKEIEELAKGLRQAQIAGNFGAWAWEELTLESKKPYLIQARALASNQNGLLTQAVKAGGKFVISQHDAEELLECGQKHDGCYCQTIDGECALDRLRQALKEEDK